MKPYSQLSKERIDLKDAIPLERPFTILIEPANVCNLKCDFCYYSNPTFRAGGLLQGPTFIKIFRDLEKWGRFKVIRVIGFGEPLINKNTPNMIHKLSSICDRTELVSNCTLLTKETSKRLVESGLDYLRVSVYDRDIRQNIAELRQVRGTNTKPFIYIKKIDGDQEFLDMYSDLADEIAIEKRHSWLEGEAGDSICPQPFKMMSIRYNGDVIVCDPDWENNTKVGNALETPLKEIWEGPELKAFWKMQMEHRRGENKSCRTCSFVDNEFYVKDKL